MIFFQCEMRLESVAYFWFIIPIEGKKVKQFYTFQISSLSMMGIEIIQD